MGPRAEVGNGERLMSRAHDIVRNALGAVAAGGRPLDATQYLVRQLGQGVRIAASRAAERVSTGESSAEDAARAVLAAWSRSQAA